MGKRVKPFIMWVLFLLFFPLFTYAAPTCGGNEICIFSGFKPTAAFGQVTRSDFSCPLIGSYFSAFSPAGRDTQGSLYSRNGIVLSVESSQPVKAAAAGRVSESEYDGSGLGHYVKLVHSENPSVITVYGYLMSRAVRQNDRVKKGDTLGMTGSSGSSHSPSLYFELDRDGRPTREPEFLCNPVRTASSQTVVSKPKVSPVSPALPTFGSVDCSRFQSNGVKEPWSVSEGGRNGAPRTYRGKPGAHTGFDFGGKPCGSAVLAVWEGEVLYARNTGEGYGNQIAVKTKCSDGTERISRYSHLQGFATDITPDKRVAFGQVIGFVGNTGGVRDCHLHLDVFSQPFSFPGGMAYGTLVNPEPLIVGGVSKYVV